jgi:hypothetical protein
MRLVMTQWGQRASEPSLEILDGRIGDDVKQEVRRVQVASTTGV